MADVSKNFAIRRLATAATGSDGKNGVPITCPIACTQVVIENGDTVNAQTLYSDPDNGSSTKTLPAGAEITIRSHSSGDPVFQSGETVCRVAPVAGAGPIIVSFIR